MIAQDDAPVSRLDAPAPIDSTPVDAAPAPRFLCSATPPEGAPAPVSPAVPVAGCPLLVPGHNTITSSGKTRDFIVVLPTTPLAPNETLPVLFLWHWLGATADDFLTRGDTQATADDERFIAVLPSSEGADIFGTSYDLDWPFDITQSQARMDEEFTFFDDMLACVEAQYPNVNRNCVSSIGVSAGALFTDQLAQAPSTTLSSFLSLSGGVDDLIIKPWSGATRKLPGIVLWGGDGPPTMDGDKDILGCLGVGMDFSVASRDLESKTAPDGHFLIECRHNCGHVEPPLDPPPGESKYAGMWAFALNHPFWLPAGTSPYQTTGLPDTMPAWCAIGAGNSVPRSGSGCPPPTNPCAF